MENYSVGSRNRRFFQLVVIGLVFAGYLGGSIIVDLKAADETDSAVILERSGAYCQDDPNCFNRLHPEIPPVARARPGQLIVFETRDAADNSLLPPEQTPARSPAIVGRVVHPLTGPVHIVGSKRGDVLAAGHCSMLP